MSPDVALYMIASAVPVGLVVGGVIALVNAWLP